MAHLLAVNVGTLRPDGDSGGQPTGIHKTPAAGPQEVRDPGDKRTGLGSGLVGDVVGDRRHHGGSDQAVYAVAHEELAHWAVEIGRPLLPGSFGENLTTVGLDVDAALVGEIWRIGDVVRLEVTGPRIPCSTFARAIGEPHWVKRFADRGRTGAYLRVLTPGPVQAGDPVVVEQRPEHEITVPVMFRALTTERHLLPRLQDIGPTLSEEGRRELAAYRERHQSM